MEQWFLMNIDAVEKWKQTTANKLKFNGKIEIMRSWSKNLNWVSQLKVIKNL